MKIILRILFLVAVVAVGLFAVVIYQERQAGDEHEKKLLAMKHEAAMYTQKCQAAYATSPGHRRILDWYGITGPFTTSTGMKHTSQADLGNSKIDVTCYFDTSGNVLNIQVENSHKDPYQAMRDLAKGNSQ